MPRFLTKAFINLFFILHAATIYIDLHFQKQKCVSKHYLPVTTNLGELKLLSHTELRVDNE